MVWQINKEKISVLGGICICFVMFLLAFPGIAFADQYTGGSGDGFSQSETGTIRLNTLLSEDPFFRVSYLGGSGDGWVSSGVSSVVDTIAPSGGSVSYTNGFYTSISVPITYNTGSDTGSGLNLTTGKIQRSSATLTNGLCGSYSSFSELVMEYDGAYTDITVSTGNCYKYQYLISDVQGNQAIFTSTNEAKVDTILPTITTVSSDKANGTYGVGTVIDIDLTFSEPVTSTGTGTITLETGATDQTCDFTVTNSSTATCNYVVQAGDQSSDLTVKTVVGTIKDSAENAVTNFVPASNLAVTEQIVIDTSPTVPSGLTGTVLSSTSIRWDWTDNSSDETGFKLYSGTGTLITTLSAGIATYTETGLTKGTTYNRKLLSYNAGGNSAYTTTVSVLTYAEPTAPSSFTGTAISSTAITWNWSDNSNYVAGFKLYDENNNLITTIEEVNQQSYTETGLTKGISYTRQITAYNDAGISAKSNSVTVETLSIAMASPKLNSPTPDSELTTVTPTFSFNRVTDVDGVKSYTLLIDEGKSNEMSYTIDNIPDGSTVNSSDYTAQGNQDSITITLKTQAGMVRGAHTWKIRAMDNLSETGDSDFASFTVVLPVAVTNQEDQVTADQLIIRIPLLQKLAQKTLTPKEVTKQYQEGKTPSRTSPSLWLDNLEKQAELRADKQTENMDQFLSKLITMLAPRSFSGVGKQLQAFNDGVEAFRKETQSKIAGWFNTLKNQVIAFFTRTTPASGQRFFAFLSSSFHNTGNWWNELTKQGRNNRLALAEQGEKFANLALNPTQRTLERVRLASVGSFEALSGNYEKGLSIGDIHLSEIANNEATLKWTTNRLTRAKVNYGESLMYGEEIFIDRYDKKQTTKLTNLKPNTKYYFEIIVTDLQYKQTYDAYYSFVTKE